MTGAIIVLLSAVIPFILKEILRSQAKNDTPQAKLEKAKNENDKALAAGDINALLDDRLRHTSPDHSGGQVGNPS